MWLCNTIFKGHKQQNSALKQSGSKVQWTHRGVVRLFNAVAKAQKQQEEAQEGGAKAKGAAQLSKAAFLAELQGKLSKPQVHSRSSRKTKIHIEHYIP